MNKEICKRYIADYNAIRTLYNDMLVDDLQNEILKNKLLMQIITTMKQEVEEQVVQND